MPIPREILNVPRPKNTVVIAYGRDKKLYAVRQRHGPLCDGGRLSNGRGNFPGHCAQSSEWYFHPRSL